MASFLTLPGQVDHFAWAPISSPQRSGTPFPVTITAQDLNNNVAASFGSTVGLQLPVGVRGDVIIGTGSNTDYYPLGTYYHDQRTQVIYLAGEVGGACRITALALNVADLPGQTLTKFTIRLKHTPLNSYSSYAWEGSGWTVVYQANLTVSATGWRVFNFTTPFEYNGADNLMVDFSFNNSSYSYDGYCAYSLVSGVRTLMYQSDSLDGDPLLWSGTSPTPDGMYSAIPNVRLTRQFLARTDVFLSPTNTGNFTSGVWSGNLTLRGTAPDVVLRAVDAVGHDGMANPLTVLDTNDVALLVSATPNPVGALSNLTYTLRVMNAGPTDASGVRLTNTLAAGVSLVSAVSSQGSCTTNGQLVTCDLGTLAGGMTATATIVVTPTIANLVLTNVASVVRNEADANPANNAVTNIVTVGPPGVNVADATVVEGNVGMTNASFALTLNAPSAQTVTVGYSTTNGAAMAGSDYVATSGVVTFAPGVTNQDITVPVIGDIAVEPSEVFYVNLSSVTGGVLATNRAAGTIINDDGLPGQVHHFGWAPISSPQRSGTPFPVTITAQDLSNNVAASFGGTVGLQLPVGVGGDVTIGTGNGDAYFPLNTYYHDLRTQVIYLAGEVGGACRITALALNVTDLPGQTLNNWTIRLKHTPLNSYSSYAWEGSGWTVVYQANLTVNATGWRVFNFTTPFEYNGADNLMVDFSFNNSSYSGDLGYCAFSWVAGGVRTMTYQSDSLDGDPLSWSGTNPTPDGTYSAIPNVLLTRQFLARTNVFLSPTNTGNFTNGVWSGNLTLTGTAPDVVLRAVDAVGHDGMANPLTVLDTNDVALLVSATPNPVGALSNLTYTLRVMNAGPTDASGVRLTNTLAAGVSLVSAVSSQGSCTTNGQLVTCDLGTLTGGMTATATIVVTPTIANLVLTNVASVVRNEADANPANNVVTNLAVVAPPVVRIGSTSVVEGNVGTTNAVFAAGLSAPSAQTVTVAYSTTNGTAVAGSDYVATNGVVMFAPGVTNQAITVPVIGDIAVEPSEVFYVDLSSVTNGVLATNRAAGTIINDDGLPGQVDHLVWAAISSPQRSGTPFPVTITAQDLSNNVAVSFGSTVGLQLPVGVGGVVTIGTGTNTANYPLGTYYHDQRTQVIYLAGEVGGACRITALALNVTRLPGQTLNNWTIRLKHTPLTSYNSYAWEGSGWTVVYQANLTVSATGWRVFNFTTPFEYNGADNLIMDFSFNNSSYTTDGYCAYSVVAGVRTLTYHTDSLYGDPLLWSGTSNPSPSTYSTIPIVRLTCQALGHTNVFVLPTNTANFINGVWSGNLTLTGTATNVVLRAMDSEGHSGASNPFNLSPPLPALRFDSSRSGLLFTNGGFRLGLTGCSEGTVAVIYASTNLVNWFPLCTNPPVAGTVEFVDFGCTNRSASFYRAEQRWVPR